MRSRDTRANSQSLTLLTYVVRFTMTETEYVWLRCNSATTVTNLERLTLAETAAEKRRIIQTRSGNKSRQLVSFNTNPRVEYPIRT